MTAPPGGRVELFAVTGVGAVRAGDDLARVLLAGLAAAGDVLRPGDVLVVSSKVVSKAAGLAVPAGDREALVTAQTIRPVAARRTPHGLARIVRSAAGPVMAAAGVDASNVESGTVLLLPADPDAAARALRARLHELAGGPVGVVVSDTAGRAWRDGQVDFALGAAGVAVTDDLRGVADTAGQPMEVTVRALADELAAAADLVKGKVAGWPAAVLRGLPAMVTQDDGPGASALLRPAAHDWFRLGHVEAVWAALGVDPGSGPGAVEPPTVPPGAVPARLDRALEVAVRGGGSPPGGLLALDGGSALASLMTLRVQDGARAELTLHPGSAQGPDVWVHLGALAQRVRAAAWSEDLTVDLTARPGPPVVLEVVATAATLPTG